MAIERLVALYVSDNEMYEEYRNAMMPILKEFGGGFGYDFKVSEVLKSEVKEPINRVFTIHFESEEKMDAFFTNTEYLAVKSRYFEPSVDAATEIARYRR